MIRSRSVWTALCLASMTGIAACSGATAPTPSPGQSSARPTPVATVRPIPTVGPAATPLASRTPARATPIATPTAGLTASAGVGPLACAYVPGKPVAQMPDEVINPPAPTPQPLPSLPPPTAVDPATTARQAKVEQQLWSAVEDNYVYPDFNGHDWNAIGEQYAALVQGGLSQDDFYAAMSDMLTDLGDDHSQFESPAEVAAADQELSGHPDYVGIGALVLAVSTTRSASVIETFPGSPAEGAGIASHDNILAVDGQPMIGPDGVSHVSELLRGPAGSQITLTVRTPGQPSREVPLTRAKVTSSLPVDHCLVPGTRIGYVLLPTVFDETIPDTMRAALRDLTADGPLDGLVLDNRENPGGSSSVALPILGLFMDGGIGVFASRTGARPQHVQGEDIGGSQDVPLAVLVGHGTVSFGEIMSGVLQQEDGAIVVGETTFGNVELLTNHAFADGSQAWIAQQVFAPLKKTYGPWEQTGIIPDVSAPSRWDLYSPADDPGLAAAVTALQHGH